MQHPSVAAREAPPAPPGTPSPEAQPTVVLPASAGASAELTAANIDRAASKLARYIGPIAGVLAKRAARRADSLQALYLLLAEELDNKAERALFLRDADVRDS